MINLTHALTFLTIIEAGGLRAAARRLDLAPSTIVDHLQKLEAELAAPLLSRRRGELRTTRQGDTFIPLARALVATAREARRRVAGAPLRLVAASNIGTYLLHQPLASFRRREQAEVDVWIGSNPAVRERLTAGLADVAVAEVWPDTAGFDVHSWHEEPLVLIVPPYHPWARRTVVTATELASETLLGGERGTGTGALLRARLGPLFHTLKVADGFGNTESVKRGVRAGLGVSLVMAGAVADEVAAGSLVIVPIEGLNLVKQTRIITPTGIPANSAAGRFLEHVVGCPP